MVREKEVQDSESQACEHDMLALRAKKQMPAEEDLARMCAAFKAIGEPSRMKILLALMEGEMCVYHITRAVEGLQSNVSHQLRLLKDAKIIRSRREGKNILYSIADEHIASIILMSKAHLHCGGGG